MAEVKEMTAPSVRVSACEGLEIGVDDEDEDMNKANRSEDGWTTVQERKRETKQTDASSKTACKHEQGLWRSQANVGQFWRDKIIPRRS